MRNVELVNFLSKLDRSNLRDLGIGVGLWRTQMGDRFNDVGDHMVPHGDWTGVQALALIELGMADWMGGHLALVAQLLVAMTKALNDASERGRPITVEKFAQACIKAPQQVPHAGLVLRMQMAAAAALYHGVDVWHAWSDDNGDVYSVANFDAGDRNEALPTDKVFYLSETL